MNKKLLFVIILISFIFVSGCIQTPKTVQEANVCGDGICGATEDCNNCMQDCGCKAGEYCSDTGICRKEMCGDEICSTEEEETQTCCEDCGCPSDKICNKIIQQCQEKATISEEDVRGIANDYMKENNISGTITRILDVYYKNETLKQVNIDCGIKDVPYPCAIILYINDNGEIVEGVRTI